MDSTQPSPPPPPSRFARLWMRISPSGHPIAWTASCGALLVLIAAVSSTTASWAEVPVAVRFAGICMLTGFIAAAAERGRVTIPTSARVLAHLGAALALPTVVSLVALAHGSWRSCTLIGGLAGVVALEVQGRRWQSPHLLDAEVAAVAVSAAGLAAITAVPVGPIISALALFAVLVRLDRRSAWLATIAAAAPVLALVSAARFGPGTIHELGASGTQLTWSAPLAGIVAAGVLARIASRSHGKQRRLLFALAALSVSTNLAIGFAVSNIRSGWPIAWAVLVTTGAVAVAYKNRPLAMAVAVVFPTMVGGQLHALHVTTAPIFLVLAVLGVVAIGCSMSLDRGFTPLDAAGFAALSAAMSTIESRRLQAMCGAVLGIAMVGYGRVVAHKALQVLGVVMTALSVSALVRTIHFTSLQKLDLFMALLVAALIALEFGIDGDRGHLRPYRFATPAVAGGAYLLIAAIATGSSDRLLVALIGAIAAIGVGAMLRLPAVSVTGAVVAGSSLAIANREQLRSLPIWVWCLAGGLALLAVAVRAERRRIDQ